VEAGVSMIKFKGGKASSSLHEFLFNLPCGLIALITVALLMKVKATPRHELLDLIL
jgi:hypothetical protein